MVVDHEVVVDGLGDVEAAEFVVGFVGEFVDDAAGVRGIVAADIEKVADVVLLAGIQDALAVVGVGLVAGGTEGRRGRVGDLVEALGGHVGEVVEVVLGEALDAVAHAEDLLDCASLPSAGFSEALDDADEGLVDDGGWAAGLADDGVSRDKHGGG